MAARNVLSIKPGGQYFLRNDDIGPLTDGLKNFVETFVSLGLPVSYQIIPALLSDACADYLLSVERANPTLIEFGQHGLHHAMSLGGRTLKREFGPERSLADQSADIIEGLDLLRSKLGGNREISVFTPPQHKYDRNTLLAIAAAGHKIFSAACYPSFHHRAAYGLGRAIGLSSLRHHGISYHGLQRPEAGLTEISISIAVDDGRKIQLEEGGLAAALQHAERHSQVVGLMFHHEVYASAEGRRRLAGLAEELAQCPKDAFRTLRALAAS